jgi:hypothetical protein
MKFETPIAEIELFELRDIISTSGGSEEPTETTDDTTDFDRLNEGNCIYHDARDNDNWNNCL